MEPATVQLIQTLGFPIAMALLLFLFLVKVVFPFMTNRIEALDKERRDSFEPMKAAMHAQTEGLNQVVEQLRQLNAKMPASPRVRK